MTLPPKHVIRASYLRWEQEEQPHFLYRCYDTDGRLIYIGCTYRVEDRMSNHLCTYDKAASVLLQRFMSYYEADADKHLGRLAGRAAERAAIRDEQPLFNLHHTGLPVWKRNARIAAYVLERTGLALEWRRDEDGYETIPRVDGPYLHQLLNAEAAA